MKAIIKTVNPPQKYYGESIYENNNELNFEVHVNNISYIRS